jgi:predicted transposase/invertase (TIGR01784 family)
LTRDRFKGIITTEDENVMEETVLTANKPMSPLADPVINAIFNNVENSGLAARSLAGCILAEDGIVIDTVTSVTPQSWYKNIPEMRGTRVDIEVITREKQRILVEIQLSPEPIMARNLLTFSQIVTSTVKPGSNPYQLEKDIPTVYMINICDFVVRNGGDGSFLQPVKLMYTKNPSVALRHLNLYTVQLPIFREEKHDLKKPIDGWLFMLDTAKELEKSVEEVIAMYPELNYLLNNDPGLQQFITRYEEAAGDPEVRKQYDAYVNESFKLHGMMSMQLEKGIDIGVEKGIDIGIVRGVEKGKLEDARNMLLDGLGIDKISKYTSLPISTIKSLQINP